MAILYTRTDFVGEYISRRVSVPFLRALLVVIHGIVVAQCVKGEREKLQFKNDIWNYLFIVSQGDTVLNRRFARERNKE